MRLAFFRLMAAALIIAACPIPSGVAEAPGEMAFHAGARSEGQAGRKYAPDRTVDILHVLIEVTPDFSRRTITGRATLKLTPIARAVDRIVLDAVDLSIDRVTGEPGVRDYSVSPETLELTFERPIQPGEEATVTIEYHAEPRRGLYFRTPELGYRPGDEQLWTQGETHEARYWYPGVDYPNERFTSEVICHVPEGMTALSNGRLVSRSEAEDGLVAWHWIQEKPHPNYLLALVAGRLSGVDAMYRDIPMAFWTAPSRAHLVSNELDETAKMLAFFEQEIGVPFPWARYDQAAVLDYLYGGMENTSLTVLTDKSLYPPEVENVRENTGLIAHELAHQWFGDYVTCKDWSHAWLNEGFATYYAALYREASEGADVMRYRLWQASKGILEQTDDTRPIVDRDYDKAFDQFSFRAYTKGAWVLHMLRSQLGEESFREGVRLYLERNALDSVVTEDLNQALEEVSGRSLDRFFDQWVYHAGAPQLDVRYQWDGSARQARLRIRQTQTLSDEVMLFETPLTIRFSGEGWTRDETVQLVEREEDFYFRFEEALSVVQIRPELELLARIDFGPGRAMLLAQLRDPTDALGRARAANALAGNKDRETVDALAEALAGDPFYGVRIESARSLRKIGTEPAVDALIRNVEQVDARVRLAVVERLTSMFHPAAKDRLLKLVGTESNPLIVAEAIHGLGQYPDESLNELYRRSLHADSFNQGVARAAMHAARKSDASNLADAIRDVLAERDPDMPNDVVAEGLEIVGFLARKRDDRSEIRDFLMGFLNSPVAGIQAGALRGLGELRDLSALGAVEGFMGEGEDAGVKAAAEQAAEKLKAADAPESQLRDLRREILDLKSKTKALDDDVKSLEKRTEAGGPDTGGEAKRQKKFLWFF